MCILFLTITAVFVLSQQPNYINVFYIVSGLIWLFVVMAAITLLMDGTSARAVRKTIKARQKLMNHERKAALIKFVKRADLDGQSEAAMAGTLEKLLNLRMENSAHKAPKNQAKRDQKETKLVEPDSCLEIAEAYCNPIPDEPYRDLDNGKHRFFGWGDLGDIVEDTLDDLGDVVDDWFGSPGGDCFGYAYDICTICNMVLTWSEA